MQLFTRRGAIARTPEFERILKLPTRVVQDPEALATEMTDALKTSNGTMRLRGVQAQALYELMTCKGLFGPMGVGTGKTLVTLLAPVVLDVKRPVLLLPAQLIPKTERDRMELAKHWQVARHMQLISYEMLGRVNAARKLEIWRPDLIIADEGHRLKNKKAGVTRRVTRYKKENPNTPFVVLSGTMIKNSLRDFSHLIAWCLGDNGAPVPNNHGELEEWADALDERVAPQRRMSPGVLEELANKEDVTEDELSTARKGFRNRLVSVPGVVCSLNAEQATCSLVITGEITKVNAQTDANFEKLRTLWETPDGWALTEAVDLWRHAQELALGFHYIWEPRPPEEWLMARKEWAAFVRNVLSHSRSLDTEKQVALECEKGALSRGEYDHWKELEPTFKINQKAIWHDDTALNLCTAWLEKEKGIVWTDHTFFGRELAKRSGRPYFGAKGLDAKGNYIEDASGGIIASVDANGTGKNLQKKWSRNLIVTCPTGAEVLEQLIGRTHRPGQDEDEVTVHVLFGCAENLGAWERARSAGEMARDMLGQPQKILIADVMVPEWPVSAAWRWKKNASGT